MATKRIVIEIRENGGERTERTIRRVGRAASSAQRAVNGFRNVLVGLAAVSAARGLTEFVDTITRIDNRLNLLTGSQTLTNQLFDQLANSAIRTRSSLESTVDLFSRLGRSTQDLGLSQQELLTFTESVNQAFQIYGNTATEASAATVQFAQGLAAGALRGDELRSVLEQAPRLAQAIAEGLTEIQAFGPETRVVIGDLRELGKEGVLTADLITRALATQADTLEDEFGQTAITLTQAFTNLQTSFLQNLREFDQGTGVTQGLAEAINSLSGVIDALFDGLQGLVTFFNSAIVPTFNFLSEALANAGVNLDNFGTKAAAAGIAVTLLFGPIGLLITAAGFAASEIGKLQNSTTALTDSSRILITELQAENEASRILTEQLNNNAIVTRQQAELKLSEAEARVENIRLLREEQQARSEALREEIQGILTRAQVLQANQADFDIGLGIGTVANSLINLQSNTELIQLEGQITAAAEALRLLDREGAEVAVTLERDTEAIQRLRDLLAGDTLVDATATGPTAQELRAAERAAERAREALEQFNRELDRVEISAGTGADAIGELERLSDRLIDLQDRGLVTQQQRIDLQEEINQLIGQGEVQAVQDLISNLDTEIELLSLSNAERELRNMLAKEGLDINEVDPAQLAQLRERLALQEATTEAIRAQEDASRRLQALENEISGGRDEIIQKQADLNMLFAQGRIDVNQFNDAIRDSQVQLSELALAAGDGTLADSFTVLTDRLLGDFTNLRDGLTDIFADIGESLTSNFGDAVAQAIVDGEDFGELLKSIARDALKQLISSLVQLGVQFLINQLIAQAGITAINAAATQQAGVIASAYAPAAALVSLATSGGNSIPAIAGIGATTAVSAGVAALTPGFADGGLFRGVGTGMSDSNLARISDGEFIVNAAATAQNLALLEAINNSTRDRSTSAPAQNRTLNFNLPNVSDPDTFRRSTPQLRASLRRDLDAF